MTITKTLADLFFIKLDLLSSTIDKTAELPFITLSDHSSLDECLAYQNSGFTNILLGQPGSLQLIT